MGSQQEVSKRGVSLPNEELWLGCTSSLGQNAQRALINIFEDSAFAPGLSNQQFKPVVLGVCPRYGMCSLLHTELPSVEPLVQNSSPELGGSTSFTRLKSLKSVGADRNHPLNQYCSGSGLPIRKRVAMVAMGKAAHRAPRVHH